MKLIGIVILNILCISGGIMCAYKTRVRCETARQLIIMADMLAADLLYSADDSRSIIRRLACEKALARLTFLKDMDIENINISTGLEPADDERVNLLFKTLGGTDTASMLRMIESFKECMEESLEAYRSRSASHSRLYAALGVLGGLAVSAVLI